MNTVAIKTLIASLCLSLAAPAALAQGLYQNGQVPGLVNQSNAYCQPQAISPSADPYFVSGSNVYQAQNFAMPGQSINQGATPGQIGFANAQGQWGAPQQQTYDSQTYSYASGVSGANSPALQDSAPQAMSPYQQQEAALQQASLSEQMNDMKQHQQNDESIRGNVSSNPPKAPKESKFKGVGTSFKNGLLKYGAPAAGTVGSIFLMRAAFRGGMMFPGGGMMMPSGGMMVMPPGSMVVMPR